MKKQEEINRLRLARVSILTSLDNIRLVRVRPEAKDAKAAAVTDLTAILVRLDDAMDSIRRM